MPRNAKLTVQRWGNSLAVRIPAAVARSARFDPALHGGEVMAVRLVGKERL